MSNMKILGDYHTHTDNSDGKAPVEEMVRAAKDAGLREIAITDHGCDKWFGACNPKKYSMVKALVEKSGEEFGVKTLFGVEANITGTAGQIDFDCEGEYDNVDIVLCGVHRFVKSANIISLFSYFIPNWFSAMFHHWSKKRVAKNTEVVKRALTENNIDVYVHPNRYFRVDVVEIAKVCAERNVLIELNTKKINFRPIDFERMAATGAKFIINSDAHTPRRVGAAAKVFDFLKLCDWKPEDIVNIYNTFERKDKTKSGIKIEKLSGEKGKDDVHSKSKKRDKREKREKRKRDKKAKKSGK